VSQIKLGILAGDDRFKDAELRARLARDFELHDFSDWRDHDAETLLERCRSVEVLLIARRSPRLPGELARDFGRLRYVCFLHGSIRPYVDKPLIEAGLLVTNWGEEVAGVAEGAMALLLCQLKQIVTLNAFAKGGADQRVWQMYPPTLQERDVGLYGFGPIGRHMGRFLEAFGARVAIYDPYAKEAPATMRRCATLRELFATCQIVSIHCGLNDQTRGSVTRELLELLPQGGIVINTARGGIVEETALAELVAAGRLLAGVDVIENEKDWPGSPLASLPGALLSKHKIGSGKGYPPDRQPKPTLPEFVWRNLEAYRSGRPLIHLIGAAEYDLKT
jgi:phosphoglycerate dehydrogenase-like enzyme